ncbi:MAG: Ig-like domain repeat protein [Muribaculaceae bacterium]|nr:Ig-like domain repeat protein [Muribaculaceae bacterium]
MKKLIYLLLLLPFAALTSCEKDDLAPFDMTLTLGGVSQYDGNFYAVQGDEVTIENLTVDPVGGKNTALSNVMFYIDGRPLWPTPWESVNGITFSTANLPAGTHTIGINGNLLQVDQSLQVFAVEYKLVVVDSDEGLPEGAPELGSFSSTVSFQ